MKSRRFRKNPLIRLRKEIERAVGVADHDPIRVKLTTKRPRPKAVRSSENTAQRGREGNEPRRLRARGDKLR